MVVFLKNILRLTLALIFIGLFTLSCSKEEETTTVPVLPDTTTVPDTTNTPDSTASYPSTIKIGCDLDMIIVKLNNTLRLIDVDGDGQDDFGIGYQYHDIKGNPPIERTLVPFGPIGVLTYQSLDSLYDHFDSVEIVYDTLNNVIDTIYSRGFTIRCNKKSPYDMFFTNDLFTKIQTQDSCQIITSSDNFLFGESQTIFTHLYAPPGKRVHFCQFPFYKETYIAFAKQAYNTIRLGWIKVYVSPGPDPYEEIKILEVAIQK